MVYFMRHGRTQWNADGRLQGRTDIPLSLQGQENIHRMGERLREVGFSVDRIICSPLKRASETADIIAEELGFSGKIQYDPELLERCFGVAEGKIIADLDFVKAWDGMESMEQLRLRIQQVLDRYSLLPGDTLLVTHGAFILAAMKLLTGSREDGDYLRLPEQGNPMGAVTENGETRWVYVLP